MGTKPSRIFLANNSSAMTAKVLASVLAFASAAVFLCLNARCQEPLGRVPLLACVLEDNRRISAKAEF